jgi:peptide/nickel transport system substrate-binding protein
MKRILIILVVLLLGVVALGSALLMATDRANSDDASVERVVYGLTLIPSGFDPHIHTSSELGIPLRSVYDTLTYRDPNTSDFVPGLASAWAISDDGLTYTFTLRQDVTFHDGTRFDANAVVINFDRIFAEETASQKAAFMLPTFSRAEVVDNYTVRLVLSEPYAPTLDSLSQVYFGMASPTALAEYDRDTYQFHQVGTGPFRFVEFVTGDRLVIERNPDYAWAPSIYNNQGPPHVERIEFRFFPDTATRALALESGDVQIMGELLPADAERLSGDTRVRVLPVEIPGQPQQFFLNTQNWPTSDMTVRQALLYGTNRSEIVDTVSRGFSPMAHGPLAAATQYFNTALVNQYPYDYVYARSLLESVGFADTDGDGVLEKDGRPLQLDLVTPPWGLAPQVAQLLESQWEILGADVHLKQVPTFPALQEAARGEEQDDGTVTYQYHAIGLYFFGADPSLLDQFYRSDGSLNWSRVVSTDLDIWLTEATRTSDPVQRQTTYADVQRRAMELALVIPIRDYVNLNGVSTELEGLRFDAYGFFPILNDLGKAGDAP